MQQFVYANEGRVLLREATEEDIIKIYEMYQESYPESWWQNEELNEIRYKLIKEAKGRIFVAVLGDDVIGHAELVLPDSKEEFVYLVRLEIHDDYRRRKFGIELVRFSAIIMKDLGYKGYVTWPDTNKSKGLYKKVGLKEIQENPQLSVKLISKGETTAKKVKELDFSEPPVDLKMAVGCPWARHYIWLKAFRAGEKEVLDYKGPYVHQIEVKGVKLVVLVDGNSLYIYLPEDKTDDLAIIEQAIIYSTNLAIDQKIETLHINIQENFWDNLDLSDMWEIEKEEQRLEMKMEF